MGKEYEDYIDAIEDECDGDVLIELMHDFFDYINIRSIIQIYYENLRGLKYE